MVFGHAVFQDDVDRAMSHAKLFALFRFLGFGGMDHDDGSDPILFVVLSGMACIMPHFPVSCRLMLVLMPVFPAPTSTGGEIDA